MGRLPQKAETHPRQINNENYQRAATAVEPTTKSSLFEVPLREVAVILESTGVVSGEYGFVEAFERKKEEVKDWLNDQNEKIGAFAVKYQADLDKRIEWERKRADEDIALRKFKYGTDRDS
jgi:beta-lactamase class D